MCQSAAISSLTIDGLEWRIRFSAISGPSCLAAFGQKAILQQSQGALEVHISAPSPMGAISKGVPPWGRRRDLALTRIAFAQFRRRDLKEENAEILVNLVHERNVRPKINGMRFDGVGREGVDLRS